MGYYGCMATNDGLREKYSDLFPHLNEKERRIVAAADARLLGYGGISRVAAAAGVSRPTLYQGIRELEGGPAAPGRTRKKGGGRKKISEKHPSILEDLETLVDPATRGDPMSPLRWTCKSTRQLAAALSEKGYRVSHRVVAQLLRQLGYSLQANVKAREGTVHPDRDAQFHHINSRVSRFLRQGLPVISVDTKKKELVGNYKNGGTEWRPKGRPEEVHVHDFPDPKVGKAIPYGVYDVGLNLGWVNVGCDHDTATFAVESIRRWWFAMGSPLYPQADSLLICADGGGSNGHRVRLWKFELQAFCSQTGHSQSSLAFCSQTGLTVAVCHFPPGTSKWNKIEHCLFSHISMNWRGRPLVSHEVVVRLIGDTTTQTGLQVHAELDSRKYPTGVKVSDEDMRRLCLKRDSFHGDWNYTIKSKLGEP